MNSISCVFNFVRSNKLKYLARSFDERIARALPSSPREVRWSPWCISEHRGRWRCCWCWVHANRSVHRAVPRDASVSAGATPRCSLRQSPRPLVPSVGNANLGSTSQSSPRLFRLRILDWRIHWINKKQDNKMNSRTRMRTYVFKDILLKIFA